MRDNGVSAAVTALLASDPAVADREALGSILQHAAIVRAFVDVVEMRGNRRARELAAAGESEAATAVLIDEGRRSGKEAAAADGRDRVCEEHPEFEDALEAGSCSSAHLDVVARLAKHLSDAERSDLDVELPALLASASNDYVSVFERTLKQIIARIKAAHAPKDEAAELDRQRDESHMRRWTDQMSGMKMTLLAMDPLRDAAFHHAVDAQLAALRRDDANATVSFGSLTIDAVVAATAGSVTADGARRRVPEVVIHVDQASLCHGRHADTLSETVDGVSIPVVTAQRLCCEAIVSAVIVDADGTTRKLYAEQRTANREQRRALAAMYATCAHPHCSVGFSRCRIHHVVWWTRGGNTVIENLLPLCEEHHHLVHEGGWNLILDPDRTVTWVRPDGTIWTIDRSPNRRPGRGPSAEWRQPALC